MDKFNRSAATVSRRLGLVVGCALAVCAGSAGAAQAADVSLALAKLVAHDATVLERKSYNYAPAIIHDGSLYHLYWCAGVAGDFVLHAQSNDRKGPWRGAAGANYDVALAPSGSAERFDGQHACDPNILKLGGRYYLYYGGLAQPDAGLTAIGVAVSDDAVHFVRLNNGVPIVTPARSNPAWQASKLTYGAGQPAAVYVAPYVYLAFSDSTGSGANRINGAGQFVLRSKDPSFATGTEEFTGMAWQSRPFGRHTAEHAILESFGIDWALDAATGTLIAVTDRSPGESTIIALDAHTFRPLATGALPLQWREGPALLAEADKSMAARQVCARMDVAVFAASGASADPFTWHKLQYSEAEFSMEDLCAGARR